MNSNFSFLPSQWDEIAQTPKEAEQHVYGAPLYTAMLCRKSLEEWVRWMYEHDGDLTLPYDTSLSSLIHEQCFKNVVAPLHFQHINLIRKQGNAAVHTTAKLNAQEALHGLKLLHGFIGWVAYMYGEEKPRLTGFDESLVPKEGGKDKSKEELQRLEKAYHAHARGGCTSGGSPSRRSRTLCLDYQPKFVHAFRFEGPRFTWSSWSRNCHNPPHSRKSGSSNLWNSLHDGRPIAASIAEKTAHGKSPIKKPIVSGKLADHNWEFWFYLSKFTGVKPE
jgi:hypothetical protein